MTGVIEFLALVAASVSTSVVGATLIYYGVYGALSIGLSLGLSALANLLVPRPKPPAPEDVQQSIRQATAPRIKLYGRGKISGPWVFAESKSGNFHKVIALGQGPLDAIESFWIDDGNVTLDANGRASGGKFSNLDVAKRPRILYRLGTSDQSSFSELTSEFPEWTSEHQGKGVALLYSTQYALKQDEFFNTYPNTINTLYRVVARGAIVTNMETLVSEWSDNPADCIYDYMQSSEGMRLPASILTTGKAKLQWETAHKDCNALFPLKGGGFEPRYRLWGSYRFDERPADVLFRMLACCNGRVKLTSDGGLALKVGKWEEPTVTIGDEEIVSVAKIRRGRDVLTTANTIRATYLEPSSDYQTQDADPWVDQEDVTLRGEIVRDVSFIMSPSHSQTRRLMKIESYKANPQWVGTFICNLKALKAFNEDVININYPRLGVTGTFEVLDFAFNFGKDNIIESVVLQVQSLPKAAFDWDASSQEGSQPVADTLTVDNTIPVPTGLDVTIGVKSFSGTPIAFGQLTFDPPPSAALTTEAEYKKTADENWLPIAVVDGADNAESGPLSDGDEYQFRIKHVSPAQRSSAWSSIVTITAIADDTPPDQILNVSATGGSGSVSLSWTSPNSENFVKTYIYRNTADDFATSSLIITDFGAPNTNFTNSDTGLAADTYYYWFTAVNASNVESDEVGTGAVVVT